MNRTFLLPLLSVTSLATTACSSSIDGEWGLIQLTYDGRVQSFPATETYASDGITYTYSQTVDMSLDKDGSGVLTQTYAYSSTDGDSYNEVYSYAGSWQKTASKSFDINFDEMDLDLSCTLEDNELDCDGPDSINLIFAPLDN